MTPLLVFVFSLTVVALVALLCRASARLAKPYSTPAELLRTPLRGATVTTVVSMYVAFRFTGAGHDRVNAIIAVVAGLLVVLVIWEKRRRLMFSKQADKSGA
jgi:hypothetical protein